MVLATGCDGPWGNSRRGVCQADSSQGADCARPAAGPPDAYGHDLCDLHLPICRCSSRCSKTSRPLAVFPRGGDRPLPTHCGHSDRLLTGQALGAKRAGGCPLLNLCAPLEVLLHGRLKQAIRVSVSFPSIRFCRRRDAGPFIEQVQPLVVDVSRPLQDERVHGVRGGIEHGGHDPRVEIIRQGGHDR